jgi:uroporphyrinogen decarboxylase
MKMDILSSRERMLLAITNEQPDRVPVAPDMSNMIPCLLTGKPFWEIYYFQDPPLWQAYIEAARFYGIDSWFTEGDMQFQYPRQKVEAVVDMNKTPERWIVRRRGQLDQMQYERETTYYHGDPPTETKKPFKDLTQDLDLMRAWFLPPTGWNPAVIDVQRKMLGEDGAFGIGIGYPGFQNWFGLVEGGLEALVYWYYDRPELIEQMREWHEQQNLVQMAMILDAKPDFVLLGGSGTLTMQSPRIARQLSLPTIQKLTRMAKEAGIPTMLHSCGKEKLLVKWCAEETDLNCINPLEVAPMGDCDLAEIKQLYGDRIALMGNLHTTRLMLMGTEDEVEKSCRDAIDAAGKGGGFILSTGDQCPRDTPEANIRKMVEVAKTYGQY